MKKIYIAGKITGLPIPEVEKKFSAAQKEVEAQGLIAINPIEVVGNWECDWKTAMKLCVKALIDCDAILLLPCWMDSKGAMIEQKIASDLGIKSLIGTKELKINI
ncbi:MAG: DUF4406 domain-containing protein [Vicingaceae bacterium]|nr:DUF4406 domain-containing protein [Vicingaceae bacterium]